MSDRLRFLTGVARRHGLQEAFRYAAYRLANRLTGIEVHRVRLLELERSTREPPRDPRFESRFLTVDEVRAFAADPANDISARFAERAEHGHLCFASLLDGSLASYSWFAVGSIEPEHSIGVKMTFPADTAYTYKAYTRPEYRGLHLRGSLKPNLNPAFLARGLDKRLALIDWTNWASLRSTVRAGWRDLGVLVTIGRRRRRILWKPAAALRAGIHFEQAGA